MSDLNLRKTILEELEFQPEINAANIGVSVDNGVVTLCGHVNSYAQKVTAERVVKSIKGVRALAEEIEVKLNANSGTEDDTIARRALKIIHWSSDVPEGDVKVIVQHGRVTLEGEVDWQYQKETVERCVRKLSGVIGVDNRLILRPRLDVFDIQQRIEAALKRNAEVEAQDIRVNVEGDVVKLEGRVHLWRERQIAERAAWSVPGVSRVEDHLLLA
ncbi:MULTISPECIES: BON domain-containing protein [Pseudomonas]|uniref:Periplasmic or secreted lipoprotein n=2 Tax=Pseudomonas TaxID=286 RepID=A0AA94EVR7_9PSED|nr:MULTISPECIES: BON domain-containing protein [Pseudomonas]MBT9263702.1 BON domain-containing protein [Pseudomonas sp. MG-9]RVD79933.1 putative periplasmic or secreted lipoprotein [Pseudomonas koreensis]WDR35584.1 BON domain-containing protein [Pseudomonas serboccidentalis]